MKRIFPFLVLCALLAFIIAFHSASLYAQEMHNANSMPVYPGGNEALKEFIVKNLQYPENAGMAGISGSVVLSYQITSDGNVQNIQVMQGLSPECDAEAIRVTGLITGWTPGIRQGKPVNIRVRMPVEFKGDKKLSPGVITGKVTEKSNGLPVEGAFVVIKGTSIGTVTNAEGLYRLEVSPENEYLDFFSVGYTLQEVPIAFHATINVELDTDYLNLDIISAWD